MKRLLACLFVLSGPIACWPESVTAGEESSVLVTTIAARWGIVPDIVTAYGSAAPALDSSMTLSLQSQGRVLSFEVTAGEEVKAGQALLRFAIAQSALGSFHQAETALQSAHVDRARVAQLFRQQLATKDQLAQADKAISDAQNNLDTLTRSGSDQAELTIKAPFDGVVTTIPVAQGDTLAPGAPMMTLMRADGLVVKVGIEPSQRLRVKRGDTARLEPLTAGGEVAQGTVVRMDGLLNPKTRLIDTDIATPARILPGATFKADIAVGRFEGFIVPRTTVRDEDDADFIFQVSDGKAHRVGVEVVGSADHETVVKGAIDADKPIVVEGNHQLADGMAVRLAPPKSGTASKAAALP